MRWQVFTKLNCDNHFSQTIVLYTFNLYSVVCPLHLNKTKDSQKQNKMFTMLSHWDFSSCTTGVTDRVVTLKQWEQNRQDWLPLKGSWVFIWTCLPHYGVQWNNLYYQKSICFAQNQMWLNHQASVSVISLRALYG